VIFILCSRDSSFRFGQEGWGENQGSLGAQSKALHPKGQPAVLLLHNPRPPLLHKIAPDLHGFRIGNGPELGLIKYILHNAAAHRFSDPIAEVGPQAGIATSPRFLLDGDGLQAPEYGRSPGVLELFRHPGHPSLVETNSKLGIDEEIVGDAVVPSSPHKHPTVATEEDVAFYSDPAGHIVQVNGVLLATGGSRKVVDEVPPNHSPMQGPVSSRVDGAAVPCLEKDMMDLVLLDAVFVAIEKNGRMRTMVQEFVGPIPVPIPEGEAPGFFAPKFETGMIEDKDPPALPLQEASRTRPSWRK